MKRIILLFILLYSSLGYATIDIEFSLYNSGFAARGLTDDNDTIVFQIVATETDDAEDTLQELVFTATNVFFDVDAGILDIDVMDGTGTDATNIASTTVYSASGGGDDDTATLTISDSFDASESKTYYVRLQVGDDAVLSDSVTMEVTSGTSSASGGTAVTGDIARSDPFKITGLDATFNEPASTDIIYDADTTKFQMLDFELTALGDDDYKFNTIDITNDGDLSFDVNDKNEGVTTVYLYRDDGATPNEYDDSDTLLQEITSFSSTTNVTFDLVGEPDADRTVQGTDGFLLLYDIGASTNIQSDDNLDGNDDDLLNVSARISGITGTGDSSGLAYGPINITTEVSNNADVYLTGMVIEYVDNLLLDEFPSTNVSAELTNIPLLKFKAKAIGIDVLLSELVITNEFKTFSTTSRQDGLTKLIWYVDDGNETFDGIDIETEIDSIDLDADPDDAGDDAGDEADFNTNVKATIVDYTAGNAIAINNSQVYFILADFGSNMSAGDQVSLNVGVSTRASYDEGDDDVYTNDGDYSDLEIGSQLPLSVTPTQDTTLIDPDLILHTDYTDILFANTNSGSERLVAGMYDLPVYGITIDVNEEVTDASFEFDSPHKYFSSESTGISKLSLYLDMDKDDTLTEGDIFLASTETFTNSGGTATVTGVDLAQGQNQRLLVLATLGQRVTTADDLFSISLNNVTIADDSSVAGMFSNPITPEEFDVSEHLLQIDNLVTTIADSNVIDQDSEFDVTLVVGANSDLNYGANGTIQLLSPDTETPYTIPKFYLDGVSGSDRSYEFDVTFNATASTDQSSLFVAFHDGGVTTTKTMVFDVDAENITSEGNYLVDADVYYTVNSVASNYLSHNVLLTRSKGVGADFKSAVDLTDDPITDGIEPSIVTTNDTYSWTLPAYVDSVQVQVNNQFADFTNYQSIPQNSSLKITFANTGNDIDPASISIDLNGVEVPSVASISSGSTDNYFEYESTTGVLTIDSLGSTSGQLNLFVNDMFGEAYPDAPFIFFTSESLQVEKLLVYPNPYAPSISTGLSVGFSITQPATVSFRIYDAMGRELTRLDKTAFPMGYNVQSWDSIIDTSSQYIASGTYYIKLTAETDDGEKVYATTKLAVY